MFARPLLCITLLCAVAAPAPATAGQTGTAATPEAVAAPATVMPDSAAIRHALADTAAFEPSWVTKEQFEKQLLLVHGKVPDPNFGLFGPRSQMWRISRYLAPGLLGSGRALVLQISHPWVTAGIDEHSITRDDPLKRGRDTFRYILTMIYGDRDQALQAARDVRMIHEKIRGHLPYDAGAFVAGSEYRANELQAMIWVHATLWETLMVMYEQSIGPVSATDKEKYYQETKLFAYLFGIPESALPATWDDFVAYCEDMRRSNQLNATPASKELAGFLFGVKGVGVFLWLPMQYEKVVTAANLPEDLREAYGFGYGPMRKGLYKSTMWMSRVGHRITPGALTKSPAHKEAVARIARKKAGWYTRLQLKIAFGHSRLVNDL
ncbi:MAG: oxygenase MpaB family protein [Pseudomonadota bacterium]